MVEQSQRSKCYKVRGELTMVLIRRADSCRISMYKGKYGLINPSRAGFAPQCTISCSTSITQLIM